MNWDYISGFFDADGCVTFVRVYKNGLRTPQISFSNNELYLLEEIKEFILQQVGVKGFIATKKSGKFVNYDLKYTYLPKCISILKRIKSKHSKKLFRANLILNELQSITLRNGKYTKKMLNKRLEFGKRFFSTFP